MHRGEDTSCSSNPFTDRASDIRHAQSFKYFLQYFLAAARDIPPFPPKGNVTSMLTEIKPEQMGTVCSILAPAYPKTPSRYFIVQLIHKSSVPHFTRASIQPNRKPSLTSILGTFSILLDILEVKIISQTKNKTIFFKPRWKTITQCKPAQEVTHVTAAATVSRVESALKETRGKTQLHTELQADFPCRLNLFEHQQ